MFDIGFSELMVIGVVALIVIGPERLPKVARTLGHLFGRMQRYVNDVKADISREMQLDELRKLQSSMQEAARSFETTVTQEANATESELRKIAQEANPTALPTPASAPALADAASAPSVPSTDVPAQAATPPAPGQLTAAEAQAQLELDIAAPPSSGEKRA
ncbi:MAG: twin arginine-targeting protein translocase TatB [Betaproteobacteria bacterium]|nr:twin arginine-targeting protein translocase TatB [Betaproteobacteria bacterium]